MTAEERLPAHVFWLFGLSGAGKSTLAGTLVRHLRASGRPVLLLDGDQVRSGLCEGLGFSDDDRNEHIRRTAEVAKIAINSGICVVASIITSLESQRGLIAQVVGSANVSMVYVNASLETCERRDVKGLYARARSGQMASMIGIDLSFETPAASDLRLDTDVETAIASSSRLVEFAEKRLHAITV